MVVKSILADIQILMVEKKLGGLSHVVKEL
jgi:hypothetical protein